MLGPLLEGEMSKKCTMLWREAHFEVKMYQHLRLGALLEIEMSKKCTPLWREAHFQVKSAKKLTGTEHFWTFKCRFVWPAQRIVHRIVHLVKSEQNVRVSSISKKDGRRGTLKRIWKDAFSVASAVQETCSSEMLGGQGADFLRGVAFWSIRSSVLRR